MEGYTPRFIRSCFIPKNYGTPFLFDAINRNSLTTFLIANLVTGAVNLTIKTIYIPDGKALIILFGLQ